MIGLIFYGAIGLWLLVAFYLGVKLPQWLKLKPAWAFLFVPLVIFVPVLDEVIAWPQMQVLCRSVDGYKFAEGMDEKSASGRRVNFEINTSPFTIFPSTIKIDRRKYTYSDSSTKEVIFESITYVVRRSFVGEIVGGYILRSAFLGGCSYDENRHQRAIREKFIKLKIDLTSKP